jgi:hypothetical protein
MSEDNIDMKIVVKKEDHNDYVALTVPPVTEKMDACDVLIFFFYGIFWLFINLCPVVAQIKLIYTLCHYKKYYKGPDTFQNKLNKFATYFNTYFVGRLLWDYCKFVHDNFFSDVKWRKYLARTMCGYIIIDRYIAMVKWSYRLAYSNKTIGFTDTFHPNNKFSYFERFCGYVGLFIVTGGLATIFYLAEYLFVIKTICFDDIYAYDSQEYKIGLFLTSIVSGGLYGLFVLLDHKKLWIRIFANVSLTMYNIGIAVGIYHTYYYYTHVIIILCLVSFPVLRVAYIVVVSYTCEKVIKRIMSFVSFGYFRFCHLCDVAYFEIRRALVASRNTIMSRRIAMKNRLSVFSAHFHNVRMRRIYRQSSLTEGMEGYRAPVILTFTRITATPILEYSVKYANRQEKKKKELDVLCRKLVYECSKALIYKKFLNTYQYDLNELLNYYVSAYKDNQMQKYVPLINSIVSQVTFHEADDFVINHKKCMNVLTQLTIASQHASGYSGNTTYGTTNPEISTNVYYDNDRGLLVPSTIDAQIGRCNL